MGKALLISECNGHMYPTKPFDDGPHRQEHALRHVRVQNAAYASGEHAGCFGWCMFDYQTHKDFGSGDRICYHGVLDSFRNPKLAAAVYASQGDADPVLTVSSSMDIGDNPAGQLGTAYVFSNAQQDLEKGLRHFFEIAIQLQPYAIRGMQSNYGDEIGRMLEQVFYDLFEKVTEMQHWYEGYSDKDREFILHYHCQAVMGLLREWTKQDTENIGYIVHQIYLLLMGKAVLVSDENNDL